MYRHGSLRSGARESRATLAAVALVCLVLGAAIGKAMCHCTEAYAPQAAAQRVQPAPQE
jgi:hypothetical protein